MAKTLLYTFRTAGSCRGAVTGRAHTWSAGDTVEAPPGEFAAVPIHAVTAAPTEKGAQTEAARKKSAKAKK